VKLLLLNDYATPTAGAELVTLRLRDAFRAAGHEVRVLASRAQLIAGHDFADVSAYGTTGFTQTLSAMTNPSAARVLRRELKTFRPDLVHVNMFMWQLSPSVLPLLRDVPSLYYAQTYKAVCPKGSKRLRSGDECHYPAGRACVRHGCLIIPEILPQFVQHELWRRRRHNLDRIVAISDAVRARLTEGGTPVDDVIWPGVAPVPAGPGPVGPPVMTYAGRLAAEKGVEVLLRALAELFRRGGPKTELLIAGTGPRERKLRALASRLGVADAVSWLGQLSQTEVASRFAGAWVHAVPSTWPEPFGVTGLEAMMRGTPVLVGQTAGLAEVVIDGQSGRHLVPGDVGDLADALHQLLSDRSLAARMGVAARERALAVGTITDSAARLLEHYEEMIPPPTLRVARGQVANVRR
jgi:glycosyltransferase involved in cell wall biosynthesis